MRSRNRAYWICSIVGALVLALAVVSVMQRPQASLPTITLSDGRIFSFAGVTVGLEPLESLKPTWVNRNIGNPILKFLPKMEPILRTFRISKAHFPAALGLSGKNDVTFWILTRSPNGSGSGSSISGSPESLIVNGVEVEIIDNETHERIRPSGSGVFGASDYLSYTLIRFPGIRNQTKHVTLILRQKNEQGVLEETATWEVDIP